jgi:hypothetical protein
MHAADDDRKGKKRKKINRCILWQTNVLNILQKTLNMKP